MYNTGVGFLYLKQLKLFQGILKTNIPTHSHTHTHTHTHTHACTHQNDIPFANVFIYIVQN